MTPKLQYLPVFIIVWEFSQIMSLGLREKWSQQCLFLCLFLRQNNGTIFSRHMCILGEKGRRIQETERSGEGRRRTGGRKCQAERTASVKAEVGMVWDGGIRCNQGALWPVWLEYREWRRDSGQWIQGGRWGHSTQGPVGYWKDSGSGF